MEFNTELAPEVLTEKDETKTLPCRTCGRPCIVNMFASAKATECNTCRKIAKAARVIDPSNPNVANPKIVFEIDTMKEIEVLTDKPVTKTLPCIQCQRGCVVTTFMAPNKVICNTCRGTAKQEKREKVVRAHADKVDPTTLADLRDALINPTFRTLPLCPFDPEHPMELKSVCHTPNYGPRRLMGYTRRGQPEYEQEPGESVVYQCNECYCTVSYSTMHPMNLAAQNEPRIGSGNGSVLASIQGVREDE